MRWAEAVIRMAMLGKGELILKQAQLGKQRVGEESNEWCGSLPVLFFFS